MPRIEADRKWRDLSVSTDFDYREGRRCSEGGGDLSAWLDFGRRPTRHRISARYFGGKSYLTAL